MPEVWEQFHASGFSFCFWPITSRAFAPIPKGIPSHRMSRYGHDTLPAEAARRPAKSPGEARET